MKIFTTSFSLCKGDAKNNLDKLDLLVISSQCMRELIRVSKGEEKADLLITDADILNVYTGKILKGWSVAIKGERIASVGKDLGYTAGPDTEIIDGKDLILVPGFIDAHSHLLMYCPLHETLKYAIRSGTTTIISEAMELFFPYGIDGIKDFLSWIKDQPIKVFINLPAMHSLSSVRKRISLEQFKDLLFEENVIGLGETAWTYIVNEDEEVLWMIEHTIKAGKIVEGHGAGAKGKNLCVFAASGISSCHESISLEDVIERLNMGLYVMIREGDIRRELEAISKIKDMDIDRSRLILVSDGIQPETLIKKGYMDHIVQKAIDLGFDPVEAIKMVTVNPATHFRLDHLIGGIFPFRYADLLMIEDLRKIKPLYVISKGKVVAKEGKVLESPRIPFYRKEIFPAVDHKREFRKDDFSVPSKRKEKTRVRVIEFISPLVTKQKEVELRVKNGQILMDIKNDVLKISVISKGKKFVGFIKGFGIKKGAFATTSCWDISAILVIGADESDMAYAVNRLIEIKGGAVVCCNGKILSELSMPIGGIMSDLSAKEVAEKISEIQKNVRNLGCPFSDPLLSVSTLTTPYIPFLRISEQGLFDLKEWRKKEVEL